MKVFLIPTFIGDHSPQCAFTQFQLNKIMEINVFIAENVKTARRHLLRMGYVDNLDEAIFYEMGKHSNSDDLAEIFEKYSRCDIGVISEAGMPAVADPGAEFVAMAQKRGIPCIPMVGPSSILMALSASGLNGQNFAFCGYLPIDSSSRRKEIISLENESRKKHRTQIFIETPFRNDKLFDDFLSTLNPKTHLCIACNILCSDEWILTKTVEEWRKDAPKIGKNQVIFLFLAD